MSTSWPFKQESSASSQGGLLIGLALESLSLSWTPAPLKKQLTISLSRESHRPPTLPSRCSTLILQPCATLNSLLLQPQAPKASDQASVSASLEWQQKLEAAEALLALRESCQAPSGSISVLQPCVAPAPAGDRGLQPPNPSLGPTPASSISLPKMHLGCISPLS
ncbi:doublesex- and mab-3-related transcription factor C1-like [Kogia breviceps]|uniref:doublesex- and mab-3-related transcription factor C1-like n=1 Tax=Kogia breviceps TaxID=27615 RepID=UPI0034D23AC5